MIMGVVLQVCEGNKYSRGINLKNSILDMVECSFKTMPLSR